MVSWVVKREPKKAINIEKSEEKNNAFSFKTCHFFIQKKSFELFTSKRIAASHSLQNDEMAGNFWQSSHCQQWILAKDDLVRDRRYDLQFLTPEEYQKLNIFFANLIQVIGEQLKLRQQVIATATVYFKRFYVRNSFQSIDPLLMAPTCIFLASKVEEFGVLSNARLLSACTNVLKNKFNYAYQHEFP